MCKRCRNDRRHEQDRQRAERGEHLTSSTQRQKLADRKRQYGWKYEAESPDPAPARMLAELLIDDRDVYKLGFSEAWAEALEFVLERIEGKSVLQERADWAIAFESQRAAWQAAWERRPGPGSSLTASLLDALSRPRDAG